MITWIDENMQCVLTINKLNILEFQDVSTDRSSVHGQTAIVPRSKSEPQKCTNNNFRLVSHCSFTRRFKTRIKIDGASDKRYE